MRRPRRASSAESRTSLSRVSRSRWIVTDDHDGHRGPKMRRRRLVAMVLCTATPATVRLTMEAAIDDHRVRARVVQRDGQDGEQHQHREPTGRALHGGVRPSGDDQQADRDEIGEGRDEDGPAGKPLPRAAGWRARTPRRWPGWPSSSRGCWAPGAGRRWPGRWRRERRRWRLARRIGDDAAWPAPRLRALPCRPRVRSIPVDSTSKFGSATQSPFIEPKVLIGETADATRPSYVPFAA